MISAGLGSQVVETTLSVTPDPSKAIVVPGRQFAKAGSEMRFQVSAADPSAVVSAGGLPVGASFDPTSGEFRWYPAGTQIGSHVIAFSAVDAAGAKATALVPVEVESGDPVVTRIVNAASRSQEGACSPGAMASIEGRWLTDGSAVSDATGSSTELGGTKVWADGTAVAILSASDRELRIVCPDSIPGSEVQFVVQTDHGVTTPLQTTIHGATAALFSVDGTGAGQGMVALTGTKGVAMIRNREVAGQPAIPGEQVLVYATGLQQSANISVQIGEVEVAPLSIQAVANQPGLYQIAVTVPEGGEEGNLPLSLSGDAPDGVRWHSNVVTFALERSNR